VVRDGRDALVSAWKYEALMHDSEAPWGAKFKAQKNLIEFMYTWGVRASAILQASNEGKLLMIRYEDLHRDFEGTMRKVYDYLGVDSSADTIASVKAVTDFEKVSGGRQKGEEAKSVVRKGIEFMLGDGYDQTVFVSFNAAWIESEVTAKNQDSRPLQGQPEYTANLILGYDNISAGHQLTVLLNQNGKSIADVGVSGQPDVFLEPRLDLNVVYRFDISDGLTLKAKLENLLDDEVKYTQGGEVFQVYNRGPSIQVGIDWQL